MLGWLAALPDEVVRVRPVLTVGFAGALLAVGELDGVEAACRTPSGGWTRLTGRDRASEPRSPPAEMVVVDDAEFRRLPGMVELYRAALALAGGDVLGTVTHAQRALRLSAGGRPPRPVPRHRGCRGWRTGRAGISRPGTRPIPTAWRGSTGPGTSPTPSGAPSRWRTSGWRKAVSSEALHTYEQALRRAAEPGWARCCGERLTCTWG